MDKFTVIRHLRFNSLPTFDNKGNFHYNISNLGGITFLFEVTRIADQPALVRYTFAQCHDDDNFEKLAGFNIATEKMAAGDYIKLDEYFPEETLVDNVFHDLVVKANAKDPVFIEKKLFRLRKHMARIGDNHYTCDAVLEEIMERAGISEDC